LSGSSQNQMPQGRTFTNLAADWKIIIQQWAWFYAVCISALKLFWFKALWRHKLQRCHICISQPTH